MNPLLLALMLFSGFWTHNRLPTHRTGGIPCAGVGDTITVPLLVKVHVGPIPEIGYDFPTFYRQPGDTLHEPFEAPCCGMTAYFIWTSTDPDSGKAREWSCAKADSAEVGTFNVRNEFEIVGDLDANTEVNGQDLGIFSYAQGHPIPVHRHP